jgi:hypothetical protein
MTSRVRKHEYRFFMGQTLEKAYLENGAGEWVNFKEYFRVRFRCKVYE